MLYNKILNFFKNNINKIPPFFNYFSSISPYHFFSFSKFNKLCFLLLNSCLVSSLVLLIEQSIFSYFYFLDFDKLLLFNSAQILQGELILILSIFSSFFVYFFTSSSKNYKINILVYCRVIIYFFLLYIIFILLILYYYKWFNFTVFYGLGSFFYITAETFFIRIFIGFWGVWIFLLLYYIIEIKHFFFTYELLFLLALLHIIFILTILCSHLFLFFILIEMITLTIVLCSCLYFYRISPKSIKPVLQFFVFNVTMSSFFLFGIALLLFVLWPLEVYLYLPANVEISFYRTIFSSSDEQLAKLLYPLLKSYKTIILFITLPFFFKLTLAPFSIWVVNVYSKLPWLILFLLIITYKFVYFVAFLNIIVATFSFFKFKEVWMFSLYLCIGLSIFIGCLGFRVSNLKKILAYTTVSQFSYILVGIISSTQEGLYASYYYLGWYLLSLAGLITIFILLSNKYEITELNQLYLVKKINPFYYYTLAVIFFSIIGVPPFTGFFVKFFVFLEAYRQGFFFLAILGLVSGFLIAILYLQILLQLIYEKPIAEVKYYYFRRLFTFSYTHDFEWSKKWLHIFLNFVNFSNFGYLFIFLIGSCF